MVAAATACTAAATGEQALGLGGVGAMATFSADADTDIATGDISTAADRQGDEGSGGADDDDEVPSDAARAMALMISTAEFGEG